MNKETKTCPFCAEDIKYNAVKCKHCGEFLDEDLYKESVEDKRTIIYEKKHEKDWNPGLAAILSLIIPGAGQMYKGQVASGIAWLVFVPLGYFFLIVPGLILHLICIVTAASGNNS